MLQFSRKENIFEVILDLDHYWNEYLDDSIQAIRKKDWQTPPFEKMGYSLSLTEKEWEHVEIQLRPSLLYTLDADYVYFLPVFMLKVYHRDSEGHSRCNVIGCIRDIKNYTYGDPLDVYRDPDARYDFDTLSHYFVGEVEGMDDWKEFATVGEEDDSTIIFDNPSPDWLRSYLADPHGLACTQHMLLFHINLSMQYKYRRIFRFF